jgi:hypothetical protein
MKPSLKDFLKEHCGLSDDDVEKLERGERPDDGKALRKAKVSPNDRRLLSNRGMEELADKLDEEVEAAERRDFLRRHEMSIALRNHGIRKELANKIARGELPNAPDPVAELRKRWPDSPALSKIDECNNLIAQIKAELERAIRVIENTPDPAAPIPYFHTETLLSRGAEQTNGFESLKNFLKKG